MPIIWTRGRLAVLVATGMLLLLGGVVAGSAVGTLMRPEPTAPAGRPMLLGQENRAGEQPTRLFATTSGGALWSRQNGPGTAIRGDSGQGHGGVFTSGHRNASGLRAENAADTLGSGAGVTAVGNRNAGLLATSETVGVIAAGDELALHADGAAVVDGDLAVTGACDGCRTTALAVNAAETPLVPGNAVTVTGVTRSPAGALLLQVVVAPSGARAIGIVETAVEVASVRIGEQTAVDRYAAVDGPAAAGATLRVVVGGIVDLALADDSGGVVQPGDSLGVGAEAGVLAAVPVAAGAGSAIGYAVGPVLDGRVAVLIDAH
jgi:hypothetical protein